MEVHDLKTVLNSVPPLEITDSTTGEEADAAVGVLGQFNQCLLNVMRFSGLTPWELHIEGDELLHVLDGEVELTILTEDQKVQKTIRAGQVFIVPRGVWHRQFARELVTALFATPQPTKISMAEDPRFESQS